MIIMIIIMIIILLIILIIGSTNKGIMITMMKTNTHENFKNNNSSI